MSEFDNFCNYASVEFDLKNAFTYMDDLRKYVDVKDDEVDVRDKIAFADLLLRRAELVLKFYERFNKG